MAHAAIACFLGDTAEATMAFAATRPADIPRIALVDFRNDCVGTSLQVIRTMFRRYLELLKAGRPEEARKYKLFGVRPDTSSNMRDVSVPPLGDKRLDCGVNPRLVFADARGHRPRVARPGRSRATTASWPSSYCRDVKIAVTGGFTPAKIRQFEDLQVPADIYGVGSWLLSSCDVCGTNNDFTADVVRVRIDGRWYDLAKAGRKACDNLHAGAGALMAGLGVALRRRWLAGLISFISPCVLPIVPGYLSFISGVNVAQLKDGGAAGGPGPARRRSPAWPSSSASRPCSWPWAPRPRMVGVLPPAVQARAGDGGRRRDHRAGPAHRRHPAASSGCSTRSGRR